MHIQKMKKNIFKKIKNTENNKQQYKKLRNNKNNKQLQKIPSILHKIHEIPESNITI